MPYIGQQPTNVAFLTDQFSGNGSTTAFTLSAAPATTSSILVAISGVLQDPSTYSVVGTTLNFSPAPPTGTGNISVRFLGIPASGVTTTAYRTVTEFTATAGQTTFSVPSYTVGYIDVYRNGVMLGSADYTATNGTTVVLASGATVGDLVEVISFQVSSVLNAVSPTGGTFSGNVLFASGNGIWNTSGNVGVGTASPTNIAGYKSVTSNGSTSGLFSVQVNGTDSGYIYADSTSFSIDSKASTPNLVLKTNGTERMRIDSSGNVGIGVTPKAWNSTYKVMQFGVTGFVYGRPGNEIAVFGSNGYVDSGSVWRYAASGNTASYYQQSGGIHYWYNAPSGNADDAITWQERMRIDASGNLLVGCTVAPSTGGTGSYGIGFIPNISVSGTTTMAFRSNTTSASDAAYFYTSVGLVGFIRTSGTSTTYSTTSDYRLKENVQPMTGALAKVSALKPVTYTWKADGSDGQGFIAHELAEVVPECVSGEKDQTFEDGTIKPQGIDTSFLVATLTAAIQEQTAIINDLKSRIEVLENK